MIDTRSEYKILVGKSGERDHSPLGRLDVDRRTYQSGSRKNKTTVCGLDSCGLL